MSFERRVSFGLAIACLSAFSAWAAPRPVAAPLESLIPRVEPAPPGDAPIEVRVTDGLALAELYVRMSRGMPGGRSLARATYASLYEMREELGSSSRGALPPSEDSPNWHPTARDVVSYLYAAFLASEPYHVMKGSSEMTRLLGPLPWGPEAESSDVGKACAVLDDLERWHLSHVLASTVPDPAINRLAGALQANVERARLLFRAFPRPSDQDMVVAHLRSVLPAYRSDEAWAEGMAQLALLVNESADRPEEPLAIAEEAVRAYPCSAGGVRALAIARILRLETQDPEVGVSLEAGAPSGTHITVSHGRAAVLRFRAFPEPSEVTLEDAVSFAATSAATNLDAVPSIEWTMNLPEPPSGGWSTTSEAPPLPRKGLYRVQVALGNGTRPSPLHPIVVTDMLLLLKRHERELEVWAVQAATGAPIPDAEVRLLRRHGRENPSILVASRRCGAEGRASFEVPLTEAAEDRHFVVACRGDDLAFAYVPPFQPAPPWLAFGATDPARPLLRLALDRPNGVAGETVRWKAFVHCVGREDASLVPPLQGAPLTLSLRDGRDEILSTVEAISSPFGTASGEVVLPKLVEPGKAWTFDLSTHATCGRVLSATSLRRNLPQRVESEGLEVELTQPVPVAGGPAVFRGMVTRKGSAVAGVRVAWIITTQGRTLVRGQQGLSTTIQELFSEGEAFADAQGRFAIPVVGPDARSSERGSLFLDLRSPDGQSANFQRSFEASPPAVSLHVSGGSVFRKNEPVEMKIARRDAADGTPLRGEIILTVQRIPSFRVRTETELTETALQETEGGPSVSEVRVMCDARGEGHFSMPLAAGFYRLVATTADESGREARVVRGFVVDEPGLRSPVPVAFLLDERESGPRRFFVKGSGDRVLVEISRVDGRFERFAIAANGEGVVEVEAPPEEAVQVAAYAVRNGKLFGYQRFLPVRDERLALSLEAANPALEIRVTSPDGTPLPGIELRVLAVPEGSTLYEYNAFGRIRPQPLHSPRIQLGGAPMFQNVSVLPESSSEWRRVRVPDAPVERGPFFSESSEAGTSRSRPSLPREGRLGYDLGSKRAEDARRDAPATLWVPSVVTDDRGRASMPFHRDPHTAYRITAAAVSKDGRTGDATWSVLPRGPGRGEAKQDR